MKKKKHAKSRTTKDRFINITLLCLSLGFGIWYLLDRIVLIDKAFPDVSQSILVSTDTEIYSLDMATDTLTKITDGTNAVNNPFGTQIAFVKDGHLLSSDLNGDYIEQISKRAGEYGIPQWSQDGTQILIDARIENLWQIFLFDLERKLVRQLTTDYLNNQHPLWSLNGEGILYAKENVGVFYWDFVADMTQTSTNILLEGGLSWVGDHYSNYFLYTTPDQTFHVTKVGEWYKSNDKLNNFAFGQGRYISGAPNSDDFAYTHNQGIYVAREPRWEEGHTIFNVCANSVVMAWRYDSQRLACVDGSDEQPNLILIDPASIEVLHETSLPFSEISHISWQNPMVTDSLLETHYRLIGTWTLYRGLDADQYQFEQMSPLHVGQYRIEHFGEVGICSVRSGYCRHVRYDLRGNDLIIDGEVFEDIHIRENQIVFTQDGEQGFFQLITR